MFFVQTILPPLLLAVIMVTVLVLALSLAHWTSRSARLAAGTGEPPPAAPPFIPGQAAFSAESVDLGAELHVALEQRMALAARRFAVFKIVIQPQLLSHVDSGAVRAVLSDLIDGAMAHTGTGQVLVTAVRQGPRIQITVTDDGDGAAMRAVDLRRAVELTALHGGSLDINARPGLGTAVTLRLPVSVSENRPGVHDPSAAARAAGIMEAGNTAAVTAQTSGTLAVDAD